jgi:hypothetical protein
MMKNKRHRPDERLHIDMPFGEAVERFAGVKPAEMHANIKRSKTKKPPGGKKAPPGYADDSTNVESLRDRRMRKRNYGR